MIDLGGRTAYREGPKTMNNHDTKAADLQIGDEIVLISYPSFGGKITINSAGVVKRITATRVILEKTIFSGPADNRVPSKVEDRWVVSKYGVVDYREGTKKYYGSVEHFTKADSLLAADAARRNALYEAQLKAKAAIDAGLPGRAEWITAEKIDELIAALAEAKALIAQHTKAGDE